MPPWRLEGVIHSQPRRAVIIKHTDLRLNDPFKGDGACGRQIRNVAQIVDHTGNQNEINDAKSAGQQDAFQRKALGILKPFLHFRFSFLPVRIAEGEISGPELPPDGAKEQDCQPDCRIQAYPFAGNGQPHKQPGKSQRNLAFPESTSAEPRHFVLFQGKHVRLHIADHTQIAQQDKEYRE